MNEPTTEAAFIEALADINAECFTSDDKYSSVANLSYWMNRGDLHALTIKKGRRIIAFILYRDEGEHLESIRRGVATAYRGKGYGVKISKKLTALARRTGKSIYTYVSRSNMPSLNSNLKCGWRITDITDHWVHIVYKVKRDATTKN